jgi:hypothetical protein
MTSPERTITSSMFSPNATSRGSRIASLLPLRKVRLRTMLIELLQAAFTK